MLNDKLLLLPFVSLNISQPTSPHRHLGAFFILHHQYSAIGAELPSLLPLPATLPQTSLLQVRLYLFVRSSLSYTLQRTTIENVQEPTEHERVYIGLHAGVKACNLFLITLVSFPRITRDGSNC